MVREIWFSGSPNPDHAVDITDVYRRKLAALKAHLTQTSHIELEARIRGMLSGVAAAAGLPEGRLAESFSIISTA